jgi:hypothetical protein
MKKLKLTFIGTCLLASAMISGCTKKEVEKPKTTEKPNDQAASQEVDGALNDVNDVINNKIGGGSGQRVASYNLPCGVIKIDSSTNNAGNHKIYQVTYGGQTPCGYKYKSGLVSFALQDSVAFNKQGASFIVTFTNYSVEVIATGGVVTLNGTIKTTNVSGGYIWEPIFNSATTITHKIRGSLNVTYPDNTIRQRNFFQQRQWASTGGWPGLSLTVSGDTTLATSGVSETGYTYDGNYYYETQISTPFVWSNCGTTWAGPYLLKVAHARMNVTVPNITPAYFDVEGGYTWDGNSTSTGSLTNSCSANAYKIIVSVGTTYQTSYQLY